MAISNVSGSSKVTTAPSGASYGSAFAMVTTLFFVWGFLTSLNDILIPHLKAIFDLNYAGALLIQFAFFSAYAAFGLVSGKVVEWIGYQRTMVVGLITMGAGAVMFIPAANIPSYPLFLTALIVLAAGITALQVAANPYVTVLGPPQTASSRLNLTQAFNSLGTTIGPPLGGWLILRGASTVADVAAMSPAAKQAYRIHEAATVKFPYLAIALALIVLALAIAFYKFPRLDTTKDYRPTKAGEKGHGIWRYPHVILGAVAIFVYVGAEVSIGSFLINYFNQSYIAGLSALAAANFVPFYWGGAMVGRFIGSAVLQKVKTGHLLTLCAVVAALLVLISMATFGHVAMWSILLVGLFNSIMFPSIFTLGIAEMGPLTGEASGLLVTAIVGGALIPELQGVLADHIGIHHAFIVPVICYIYIAYYGWRGSRIIQPSS
jgi:FHS family L-fucose permease-like MFS transporter